MTRALTRQRCFSNKRGSLLRSDLTPSLIRRKLTCDTGTRLVVTSLHGQLMNHANFACGSRRLRLGPRHEEGAHT